VLGRTDLMLGTNDLMLSRTDLMLGRTDLMLSRTHLMLGRTDLMLGRLDPEEGEAVGGVQVPHHGLGPVRKLGHHPTVLYTRNHSIFQSIKKRLFCGLFYF
jgi:hypothetical protein